MIKGFKSKVTEVLFNGRKTAKHLRPIAEFALRKSDMIDFAEVLDDLCVPPRNRLEALKGDRHGSTASASTTGGGSASSGATMAPTT